MARKNTHINKTAVNGAEQFAKRHAEMQANGYTPLMPSYKRIVRDNSEGYTPNLHDVINSHLHGSEKPDGKKERREVPLLYVSSGNEEVKGVPVDVGTKGLGYIEWGAGNRWPNICALLTSMLPYTAAGWKFNTDLCAGMGPQAMYRYTQYVGGNVTEKEIPFDSAGTLLKGQIIDLYKQLNALDAQSAANNTQPLSGEASHESSNTATAATQALRKEIESQISEKNENYDKWQKPMTELSEFLANNNLMHVTLALAGDQMMFGMSFPEIVINQKSVGSVWKPKVTGICYRPAHTCRLERMDSQNRINYVYCSNRWWDKPYIEASGEGIDPIAAYPALSAGSPYKDLSDFVRTAREKNVSVEQRPTRFIMPTYYPTPGRPYYPQVAWHSIFGGSIYEMAATIVDDRATRRKNSNVIGRVIYIHHEYLNQLFVQQDAEDKRSIDDLRDTLYDELNTWLSNRDNSGQALLAFTFIGRDNKEHKSFEIVEIESASNASAEANKTELQEISSIIFFAMGLDAKLIGNTPGDTRSSGGTDLRERYLLKQIQMSPTASIILKPLDVATRFNDWDTHLVWRIRREVLTTLDNSKTGITAAQTQ